MASNANTIAVNTKGKANQHHSGAKISKATRPTNDTNVYSQYFPLLVDCTSDILDMFCTGKVNQLIGINLNHQDVI